ncbi:MAG: chemotaxis protein CheW [Parachlamydia sp.]|jgi:chemotaxis-related protein WspB|nr:chemotaxis protein CheW [Parachlamydia sp.]
MMLLFFVGENRYVIENKYITKIFPHVLLDKISLAPSILSGLMNWEGNLIPIFNFCQLIENREASDSFHTRIIIIHPLSNDSQVGLLAEKVIDIVTLRPGISFKRFPFPTHTFIDEFYSDEHGTVQVINIEKLFSYLSQKFAPQESDGGN